MRNNKSAQPATEKHLFRRQFILGPDFIEQFHYWKKLKIVDRLFATIHPDLNCVHRASATSSITLLGFILDPAQPEATDSDIVEGLFEKLVKGPTLSTLIESTYGFGGRWLLIVCHGNDRIVFNDACGYRTAYYTDFIRHNKFWCASQPGLFSLVMELDTDPQALDFLSTENYSHFGNKEYFYPGDGTQYPKIKHLLPNHYLSINEKKTIRYWPQKRLAPVSLDDCVNFCTKMTQNLLYAANCRYDLALALTSGRDSRVLTAAAKNIIKDIFFFSKFFWDRDKNSPDIVIPKTLLKSLGIKHHTINCKNECKGSIKALYEKNVDNAHEVYQCMIQGMQNQIPQNMVWVKGNAIPIAKRVYHNKIKTRKINPENLAKAIGTPSNAYAIKEIKKWMEGAKNIYNIDLLDLFQWEIKEGNWQAYTQLEFDLAVGEIFVPYNCRTLLETMLALDYKFREPPTYEMHTALIKKMWPELLKQPINPPPIQKTTLRTKVKKFVPKKLLEFLSGL